MARREGRLRAGAPLVVPLATDGDWLVRRVLRFFFRTEPLASAGDFDGPFFFLLTFTFAKRLSPREKRHERSLPDKIPWDGSEGGPDRLSVGRSAQRLIRFAVAADYTAHRLLIPGVFRLITGEIRAFNI